MKRKLFGKLNMNQLIVLVFIAIILVGACLLTLPWASRTGESIGFFNALFTATSATCVTGLSVGDTWTLFSPFGQAVMLVLIEVGGLGFMSIVSMFIFLVRRKADFGQSLMIAQTIGTDNMRDVIRIQKRILIGSFAIEGVGAVILFVRFLKFFEPVKAAWYGLFHSVSAFCNAGFDLLGSKTPGGSVTFFATDAVVLLTLAGLIILGGLGFIVWDEVIRVRRASRWSAYTKLVLIATGTLLVLGTVIFLLLEKDNPMTMGDKSFSDKLLMSFFQSSTTRTAGFAGVDQGALTDGGKAATIFFMFIGGSSGSTAGGLKTVTFLILLVFIMARARGKDVMTVFSRTIPEQKVMDAMSLFGLMILLSFIGGTLISVLNGVPFLDGLYESVSALATVGLSTGITAGLSVLTKVILIFFMFFGRVGLLTIALGFLKEKGAHDISYPDGKFLVG